MKISTFPKYEDLWWKGRVAFLFWKGSFIKEKYDIYLRDSGGEGGNGFGSKFSWHQGITIHLGKLTLSKASWLQG